MKANLTFRPNVRLTKELNSKGEAFIIIRLSFNKKRVNLGTGYTISPEKWDEKAEKVKRNAANSQNFTFAEINDGIANLISIINGIFKKYEQSGEGYPTIEQVKEEFRIATNRKEKV